MIFSEINYRTSHQIRSQADRLFDPHIADVDGNVEERKGTISLFDGPKPEIRICPSIDNEIDTARQWISRLIGAGLQPHEIALFVRSAAQLDRLKAAIQQAGVKYKILDEHVDIVPGFREKEGVGKCTSRDTALHFEAISLK